ncbi:MAG: neutral/alkaline non-lysosomal ceramidase N-terminal domain-containing protein [bacterium]
MIRTLIKKSASSVLVFLLAAFITWHIAFAAQLRAGAAWTNITPEKVNGVNLAGYTTRKSDGLHDPITVRCAVIDDGETKLAIAAADLLGIFYEDIQKISDVISQKTAIPTANILIHAIHTHSGPDVLGLWGGPPKGYKQKLTDGISACIADALSMMRPAKAYFASGTVDDLNINRRHYKEKSADKTIAVMRFEADNGDTIFTLVNFALHPVVLGADNLKITADYVFYFRQKIEKDIGGISLFVSRDLGDANPPPIHDDVYDRSGGTFEMAEKIGNSLADVVKTLLSDATLSSQPDRIKIAAKEVQIPVENPRFLSFMKTGLIKRKVKNDSVTTAVAVVDLGAAQILTFPGEAVSTVREEIEPLLPGPHKFFFGLTYDAVGYIIHPVEWNDSKYEESMSLGRSFAGILKDVFAGIAEDMFK